mmetsp:Transcript_18279/g.44005  ORF Transcript_18279/g.44005 Transcript_18279/m.44005 type:complete len:291 (+) Transcript_18279:6889-7761(+)
MQASCVSVCSSGRNEGIGGGGVGAAGRAFFFGSPSSPDGGSFFFESPSSPAGASPDFPSLRLLDSGASFFFFGVALPVSLFVSAENIDVAVAVCFFICFLCSASTFPYSLFLLAGFDVPTSSPPSSSSVTDVGCAITSRMSRTGGSHLGQGEGAGDCDEVASFPLLMADVIACVIMPTRPCRSKNGLSLGSARKTMTDAWARAAKTRSHPSLTRQCDGDLTSSLALSRLRSSVAKSDSRAGYALQMSRMKLDMTTTTLGESPSSSSPSCPSAFALLPPAASLMLPSIVSK